MHLVVPKASDSYTIVIVTSGLKFLGIMTVLVLIFINPIYVFLIGSGVNFSFD